MPDWKQIVRKKVHVIDMRSPDFIEELAAHLEDTYEALLCDGLPAEAAFQHTMGEIEGRCRVSLIMRFLREELMTGFIHKIALPGLLTSAAAYLFYGALELGHIRHEVIWLLGGQSPLWWWCALPLFGVLGALLSRKGGSPLQRTAASLLPSAILGTLTLLIFVVGFTFSSFVNHYQMVATGLESMALVPPGFVVIPAVCSLLGAGMAEFNSKEFPRLA